MKNLIASTTLEWTARVVFATQIDTGRLRSAWQTDIKPFEEQFLIMSHMQSLYALVLTCHHHGAKFIEQDKILLRDFQSLLEKSLRFMPKDDEQIKRGI